MIPFIFLTGFLPIASLLGPGLTIISSGNVYKAGAQIMIDHTIKKKTGKNSLTLVKEEVVKQNEKRDLNRELKKLVKKRIEITRKIIAEQNNQKIFNRGLKKLVAKRFETAQKKINFKKINQ